MRILIIGGTKFVGRHLVEAALAKGHSVTLFHRGQTGSELFDGQVERVLGDRNTDLQKLAEESFDAIVDTCAYRPREVRSALSALGARAGHYILISTISVYSSCMAGDGEDAELFAPMGDDVETINAETYGPLKVGCELEVNNFSSSNLVKTIVRPGYIVGPWDPTDRFTYYVARANEGGTMIAPPPGTRLQVIHGRDLAEFLVKVIEDRTAGTFNAVGPEQPTTIGELIRTISEATAQKSKVTYVPTELIEELSIPFPLYSADDERANGIMQLSYASAAAAGLAHRSLLETVEDTLNWVREQNMHLPLKVGLSAELEREVLERVAQRDA